jgi:galactoside O-acetyltransferase
MKSCYLKSYQINKIKFGQIGSNCRISNYVTFINPKNIILGKNVRIDDFCVLSAFEGKIIIGDDTHIASFTYILGASGVSIGNNCKISQGVKIYSKSDEYKKTIKNQFYKKVVIADNVIIGSGSVILPGSNLGTFSRVGALTLVKNKIPKNSLFYGKKIKRIY